jgi:hypothetical protein
VAGSCGFFPGKGPGTPSATRAAGESKHGVSEAFLIVRARWHGLYRLVRRTWYDLIVDLAFAGPDVGELPNAMSDFSPCPLVMDMP